MGTAGEDPFKNDRVGGASGAEDKQIVIANTSLIAAVNVVPIAGVLTAAFAGRTAWVKDIGFTVLMVSAHDWEWIILFFQLYLINNH